VLQIHERTGELPRDTMSFLRRCAAGAEPTESGPQELLRAGSNFLRAQLFHCRVERPARFTLFEAEAAQAAKHLLEQGDAVR
jgi:hypothetical protein